MHKDGMNEENGETVLEKWDVNIFTILKCRIPVKVALQK